MSRRSGTWIGTRFADKLYGGNHSNQLFGGAGNDLLDGGLGADRLSGGAGRDTFLFDSKLGGGNVDRITDFVVADDTIRLENAVFAKILGTGTLTAGQFVANESGHAQDANDRVIYETDTGKLFYDRNGSADGGAVQFATLSPHLAITHSDFFVI